MNKDRKEKLQWYRDEWSEEIPEEIIHSGMYKVRAAWFTGVISVIDVARDYNDIKSWRNRLRAKKFMKKYASQEFKMQELITINDIEAGNKIINQMLTDPEF